MATLDHNSILPIGPPSSRFENDQGKLDALASEVARLEQENYALHLYIRDNLPLEDKSEFRQSVIESNQPSEDIQLAPEKNLAKPPNKMHAKKQESIQDEEDVYDEFEKQEEHTQEIESLRQ